MPVGLARGGRGRTKPAAGVAVDPAHPLAQGLQGAWLFTTGSVPADGAGSQELTTLEGAPLRAVGPFGGEALSFDGSADNVVLPAPRFGLVNQPRSVVVWWYAAAEPGGTSNLFCLNAEDASPTSGSYWQVVPGRNAGRLRWETGHGGFVTDCAFPAAGVWHQTVTVFDGTTGFLYVDGVLEASAAATFNAQLITQAFIAKGSNSFSERLACLVDHFLWYDRPLTAEEVAALYQEPFAFVQPSRWLVAPAFTAYDRGLAGAQPEATAALLARLNALSRPDADVAAGGWTTHLGGTTDLYQVVDEAAADDADYVQSGLDPTADTLVLSLGPLSDAGVSDAASHRLRFRYRKPAGATVRIDLAVTVQAGATDVATRDFDDIPDDWTEGLVELTAAEVGDFRTAGGYSDPRLKLVATQV